ncbi:AAA family ATPase [Cystobacter fuscus]|uniref:AAA family ATPase n=1 Tax=Cystobacter fuscus TaxID=43 RepID=UPI0037BF5B93
MVKLQWLQVNKFRSVKPGTRLTFNKGHNVLLGQNGTGKTTLLNLIAAAIESDFADFKDEEFDLSYELISDTAVARISVQNENQRAPILSGLEGMSGLQSEALVSASRLRAPVSSVSVIIFLKQSGFQFKLELDGKGGSYQRMDESAPSLALESSSWGINESFGIEMVVGMTQLFREKVVGDDVFVALLSLFPMETTSRFDESLVYFNSLGERVFKVIQDSVGHIRVFDFMDLNGTMSKELAVLARQDWGADRYVLTSDDLPFLARAAQLLDFESAEAIVELQESTKTDEGSVMQLRNLRFYFRRPSGARISEKMLSYGQKRMLAFMHYLASTKSAVIADELVNGLHHGWIRACFELLGERQVFLTSQNPLLLDYLNFQSPEDVRSTFVLCRRDKGSEQMVWENMSQEAAEDFFDSYKVGFQQVGELLQTKALW